MDNSRSQVPNGYRRIHESLLRSMGFFLIVFSIALAASSVLQLPNLVGESSGIRSSMWQNLFFYFNGFSFFSSLCGLLLCAAFTFSPFKLTYVQRSSSVEKEEELQLKHLAITLPKVTYVAMFLILSLTCCTVGYMCAGLAKARNMKSGLAVFIPCTLGGFVFIQVLYIFGRNVVDFWSEVRDSHADLWEALKRETKFGHVCSQYLESCSSSNTPVEACRRDNLRSMTNV